jgi:hypothetical protein
MAQTRAIKSQAARLVKRGSQCTWKTGPFLFGTPEDYARGKSAAFPNEGGPAMLEVDVPDDIVALTLEEWLPLSQGLVQFDLGKGIDQLLAAWPTLSKRVILLESA